MLSNYGKNQTSEDNNEKVAENNQIDEVKKIFEEKDSDINPYYEQFKTHQFD